MTEHPEPESWRYDLPQYDPRPRTAPCRYCAREVESGKTCICAATPQRRHSAAPPLRSAATPQRRHSAAPQPEGGAAVKSKHPTQPIGMEHGRACFKENKIVSFLLDFSTGKGVGLNELVRMPWSSEDYEQLMQLIGYSVDGYCELSRVSDASKAAAEKEHAKLKK